MWNVTETLHIHVDTWWNFAHVMIAKDLEEILANHHVDENLYNKKLRPYKERYLGFIY